VGNKTQGVCYKRGKKKSKGVGEGRKCGLSGDRWRKGDNLVRKERGFLHGGR